MQQTIPRLSAVLISINIEVTLNAIQKWQGERETIPGS